jgi:serine/threonine kinase 16
VGTRELKLTRLVAEGGFSFVWAATDVRTGEAFAVKQVLCQSPEQRAAVRHEIDVHMSLSHPNVARLIDYAFQRVSEDGTERASLVLPLWPRGTLQDAILVRLPNGPYFDEAEALRLFSGLVQGVQVRR